MPGHENHLKPHGLYRGAALTLLFASVLATAAATDSLPRAEEEAARISTRSVASTADRDEVARAAAEAMADGKSATEAAEDVVSRSGDRWGAVYDKGEYAEFERALDGKYTGVGLSAKRLADGRIAASRVQPGGPAARAGIRAGDILRTIDGRPVGRRPVTEVVALLRGDGAHGATGRAGYASEGSTVVLGLTRGAREWTETLRRASLSTDAVILRTDAQGALVIKVAAFTKGSGKQIRDAVLEAPGAPASCSTSGGTRAGWSPRPSRRPPPSSTAAWSPRTTYAASSAPCTRTRAATPSGPWSRWSTAAR